MFNPFKRIDHQEALQAKRSTEAKWPVVHSVVSDLRKIRERNHFAESIQYAMGGKK